MKNFLATKEELLARYRGPGSGQPFMVKYAELMDGLVLEIFHQAVDKHGKAGRLALVALGGYGRGRLAPCSDVDLLFLTDSPARQKEMKPLIESVLYPLWDLKLEVGHAVRTPGQCLDISTQDFTTLATQLDARFLAGDQALFHEFETKLQQWLGPRSRKQAFLRELKAMVAQRHRKYMASPYLLEPNVKEGQGALRDIHAIGWAAVALYNFRDLPQLSRHGLLPAERLVDLETSRAFINDVRYHLHGLAKAKTDTLTFDLQVDTAGALGYQDNGHLSGVEKFMQEYYTHVYQTKSILEYFLSRVEGNLLPRKLWRLTNLPRRIEKGLEILRGQVELGSSAEVEARPALMMRVFEISAASGLPISQRSLELIRTHLPLVDDAYRRDPVIAASFLKGLTAIPPKIKTRPHDLDAMQILHFLQAYFPELASVRAQVQHDAYHVYTVDVHLVVTLWELKKIAIGLAESEGDGFDRDILSQVPERTTLFLAALFHDIGKGHGREHARLGAEMIPAIGDRLGLSPKMVEDISFLVAEHLYLIEIASRRDLSEEKLIVSCARRISDVDRLNMLYLLTLADSRATGPGVLNPWKASLLKDLYAKVYRVLTRSDLAGRETAARTEALLGEVVQRLEGSIPPTEIDAYIEKMSAYYLSVMTPDQVVKHILMERQLPQSKLIWEVEEKEGGYLEVTILTQDRPGLLSRMAGVFTLNNINILGAQVFTRAGNLALEIFQVDYPPDRVYVQEAWKRVKEDALKVLTGRVALEYRLAQKRPLLGVRPPVTRAPDKVAVDNETSDFYTIVEVYTYDRLGLLYEVTRTFYELQLSINIAKISTKIDQVVDVFYVRDHDGQKVTDEDVLKELQDALLFTLAR